MKMLSNCSRLLAMLVVFSVLQVYAIPAAQIVMGPNGLVPPGQSLSGRLTTGGNKPVTVNGSSAKSGDTIFSGQTIQTPTGVGASVSIPGIGRLDLAPNSNVSITFSQGQITVSVTSGCVILTTQAGVVGQVDAQGKSQKTDVAAGSVIDLCTGKDGPLVNQGAAASNGAGATTSGAAVGAAKLSPAVLFLLIGGAGAGVITAIVLANRNNNPSTSSIG